MPVRQLPIFPALLVALLVPQAILAFAAESHSPTNSNPVSDSSNDASTSEPPVIASAVSMAAPPSLLLESAAGIGNPSAVQRLIKEAERHFHLGKFLTQEGKPAEARAEFDLAVNTLLDAPADLPDRHLVERKFEALSRLIHGYDIESLGSAEPTEQPGFQRSPLAEILEMTFPIDPRWKDEALSSVRAGVSQLPLTVNDAVLSYISFFSSERGSRTVLYGLRRAGRYRDMIMRVLAEEGVPQELIHLAQAESGFMPRAVSRKAATGMWQFIRSRGTEYGLYQSSHHDDRLDAEKATRAAARHLRDLYNEFGDWYLAMAAYNCGPGCVSRAVERTGYADFWELRRRSALPRETMNYVPAILALTIVSKNLEAYGLQPLPPEPALEYDSVRMSAPTNLSLIADVADRPVSEVRELNPALLKNLAPAGYEVRVPKGTGQAVLAALETVPADKRASWRMHKVSEGETIADIARLYDTRTTSIIAANSQLDTKFFESPESGEVLLIPATLREAKPAVSKARRVSTRVSARSFRPANAVKRTVVRSSSGRSTSVTPKRIRQTSR